MERADFGMNIPKKRSGVCDDDGKGVWAMAKKERPPITVKAFVKVNGVETDVDTLTPEQRIRLATELNVTMMNELYAGVAHFFPAKQ